MASRTTPCLIGLGSKLDDRETLLHDALQLLSQAGGIHVDRVSSWHTTAPVGGPARQSSFLNGAALLYVERSPHALLATLHEVERKLGRKRHHRWGARRIDLDLLLYGNWVVSTRQLTVPHPWMALRRFVLAPAAEIGAEMIHPILGWTIAQIDRHLRQSPRYVALTDFDGRSARIVAAAVAPAIRANYASAGTAGSSGPEPADAIELLRRRVAAILTALPSHSASHVPSSRARGEWTISDFWLPDFSQPWFRVPQPSRRLIATELYSAMRRVPRPRLVIAFDCGSGAANERASLDSVEDPRRHFLLEYLSRPGSVPHLVLRGTNLQQHILDVEAALLATELT
ncbi:MAG: 2-amino-4-hydroxy-6-hydroxymethyldihydropteridine diphosphokinase [Planctomycetales bacterium]|nr:2-amino-4-hydroxy-6-hydroxymethyldihydropteridine diphosphokinase [Planctomycetales bacterium]